MAGSGGTPGQELQVTAIEIHIPVLADEVIMYLKPEPGGIYVDGTLGLGGHAEKILEASAPNGRLVGFEWDADALAQAQTRLKPYGERFLAVRQNFAAIKAELSTLGLPQIDGLLLDLGLSSLQLDSGGRGFSFKGGEPLDMRMDSRTPISAADYVNRSSETELADIFYHYGEERQARRIAARIVEERRKAPIETSDQLAALIAAAVPKRFHPHKIHVATRVFQALRIAVNRELENLAGIIDDAHSIIRNGGRLCIISFHSLEDRIIKWKFRQHQAFRILTKKPVLPSSGECRRNPRARSAKLRVAELISEVKA